MKTNNSPTFLMKDLEQLQDSRNYCRDFYSGGKNIEKYISKMEDERSYTYENKLGTTPFVNLVAPIINMTLDLATRDKINHSGFDSFDFQNVDLKGNNIESFMRNVGLYSLIDGGVFITINTKKNGLGKKRVYLKMFTYDQLMNFSFDEKDDKPRHFTFKEIKYRPNGYNVSPYVVYQVYYRNGGESWIENEKKTSKNNTFVKKEWSKNANSFSEPPVLFLKSGIPLLNNNANSYFPLNLQEGNPNYSYNDYFVSPRFYDLAKINQSILHYESLLSIAFLYITKPIFIIFGHLDKGDYDTLSTSAIPNNGLILKNKQIDDAKWLELDGKGIKHLLSKIEMLKKDANLTSLNALRQETGASVSNVEAKDYKDKGATFINIFKNDLNLVLKRMKDMLLEVFNIKNTKEYNIRYIDSVQEDSNTIKLLEVLFQYYDRQIISREEVYKYSKKYGLIESESNYKEQLEQLVKENEKLNKGLEKQMNIQAENKQINAEKKPIVKSNDKKIIKGVKKS